MAIIYEDDEEQRRMYEEYMQNKYEEYIQNKYEEEEEAYQKAVGKAYSTWLKEWSAIKWQDLQGVVHEDYEIAEIWSEDFSAGILFGGVSITQFSDDGEELDTLYLYEKWDGKAVAFNVGTYEGKIIGRVLKVDEQ
jgi:hypothetical protein